MYAVLVDLCLARRNTLDGVGTRRDADYLGKWIKDPLAVKPDTKMPKFPLTDAQITELVQFLAAQKEQGK